MNEASARQLLKYLGATSFSKSGSYLNGNCPFAPWKHSKGTDSSPSFGIKLDTPDPHYTCFSCNSAGSLAGLLLELAHLQTKTGLTDYNLVKAREIVEQVENDLEITEWSESVFNLDRITPIPEWWLESFKPAFSSKRAGDYLTQRGVTPEQASALELVYDKARDYIGFPVRDFDNLLVGMRGRKIELCGDTPNDFPRFHDYKYNNVSNAGKVWLGESRVDLSKPIIIVEGNFDYTRVHSLYPNVLAGQTVALSLNKIKRLMGAWNLVLFLDNDLAGAKASDKIESVLSGECLISRVDYPKVYKDPGSIPLYALEIILQDIVKL